MGTLEGFVGGHRVGGQIDDVQEISRVRLAFQKDAHI